MLLAKTLRSSTLRLALLAIAIFGAAVLGLFSYVYWSTASFMRSRADRAIAAEQAVLLQAYGRAGRSGLIAAIDEHIAQHRLAGARYATLQLWYSTVRDLTRRDAPWRAWLRSAPTAAAEPARASE